MLAFAASGVNVTNYPIPGYIQPNYWFWVSSVQDKTNYNVPYTNLVSQLGNDMNVVTNNYSGTFTSVAFTGDGSGLYNIQSGVSTKKMNLIFVGDSLTQEPGSGTDSPHTPPYSTYPLYLREIWTNVYSSYLSRAVGGWQLHDLTNDWGNVLSSTDLSLSNNVLFVQIGNNDFKPFNANAITNAATWLVTWDRYCSNAQAVGMQVVGFTVTDRASETNDSTHETFRSTINAGIRIGPHINFLVDLDAQNPTMDTNLNWRTYDGIHPNTNGAMWQAKYVDRCITPGFGFLSMLSWFNVQSVGPPAVDQDYLKFIARSGITNDTLKVALQNLIYNGKTHGWWPTSGQTPYLDFLYLFCGNTVQAATLNLVNTNFTITLHGNTYLTNGLSGDGVTGYGDTGFNPSTVIGQFQQIDALLAFDIGHNITINTNFFGIIGCGTGTNISPGTWMGIAPGTKVRLNCLVGDGVSPFYNMNIACRTNDVLKGYVVGGFSPTASTVSPLTYPVDGALPNANITLMAINSTTSGPTNFWTGPLYAAAAGRSMPAYIAQRLWNDIRIFNTAIGRY